MKFRDVFYKAKIGDGKALDDGINIVSSAQSIMRFDFRLWGFSHEEIWTPQVFEDEQVFEIVSVSGRPYCLGKCFSAASRGDKKKCVRFDYASNILKNAERWQYIEFEVPDDKFNQAMDWAYSIEGADYDEQELLKYIFFFLRDDPNKWICSPTCMNFKMLCGLPFKQFSGIDPLHSAQLTYDYAIKAGQKKPLKKLYKK